MLIEICAGYSRLFSTKPLRSCSAAAKKSLSGSAAKTTIWLSGLAADTSLSGMAAKTKTLLSGLAAVKHGSQDQHGPNLFFHNPWLSSLCLCNARRR